MTAARLPALQVAAQRLAMAKLAHARLADASVVEATCCVRLTEDLLWCTLAFLPLRHAAS